MGIGIIVYAFPPALIISILFALFKVIGTEGTFFKKLRIFVAWLLTSFTVVLIAIVMLLIASALMSY